MGSSKSTSAHRLRSVLSAGGARHQRDQMFRRMGISSVSHSLCSCDQPCSRYSGSARRFIPSIDGGPAEILEQCNPELGASRLLTRVFELDEGTKLPVAWIHSFRRAVELVKQCSLTMRITRIRIYFTHERIDLSQGLGLLSCVRRAKD